MDNMKCALNCTHYQAGCMGIDNHNVQSISAACKELREEFISLCYSKVHTKGGQVQCHVNIAVGTFEHADPYYMYITGKMNNLLTLKKEHSYESQHRHDSQQSIGVVTLVKINGMTCLSLNTNHHSETTFAESERIIIII